MWANIEHVGRIIFILGSCQSYLFIVTFQHMDFKKIDNSYLEDYNAEANLYRHKSGMEVYHVLADDKELYFAYSFVSLPENSSGVFHIIEHTVLSGSARTRKRREEDTCRRLSGTF